MAAPILFLFQLPVCNARPIYIYIYIYTCKSNNVFYKALIYPQCQFEAFKSIRLKITGKKSAFPMMFF